MNSYMTKLASQLEPLGSLTNRQIVRQAGTHFTTVLTVDNFESLSKCPFRTHRITRRGTGVRSLILVRAHVESWGPLQTASVA